MEIKKFEVGDVLEMKKAHPCGARRMRVLRVGSDIRILCVGCGRDVTVPREKLEKNIRKIIPSDEVDS
ncbi:MAG: DUF951 domain-containing protein [Clostridia bacterium]|nr:DUF951 domain-containing protein [Clostridia bacterium]